MLVMNNDFDFQLFSSPVAAATVMSKLSEHPHHHSHHSKPNIMPSQQNHHNPRSAFQQPQNAEVAQLRNDLKHASAELDRYKQLFTQIQGNGPSGLFPNFSAMNLSSITGNNTQKPKKGKAKSKKAQQAHHEDCPCCGSANKPYQCDWPNCFKRFRQRPHLQAHQNIHTGVRFICEFPGCGKSFVRKYNLQEHSKLHTNRNPNICSFPDCNKFFSSKYSLTRHQAAQHQI